MAKFYSSSSSQELVLLRENTSLLSAGPAFVPMPGELLRRETGQFRQRTWASGAVYVFLFMLIVGRFMLIADELMHVAECSMVVDTCSIVIDGF